jgi:hypothetical protein
MSPIGGPGGIGGPSGPKGPSAPTGVDGAEGVDDVAGPDRLDRAGEVGDVEATTGAAPTAAVGGPADVDALAAEIAAGRLTPREAIDRLVDATAGPGLGPAERAELRELLTELVASDPYLAGLAGRI